MAKKKPRKKKVAKKTNEMTKKERIEFRLAARRAIRKARRAGEITRLQAGRAIIALVSDDNVEDAADACLVQAMDCGLLQVELAEVHWSKVEADIEIEKLLEFLLPLLILFI